MMGAPKPELRVACTDNLHHNLRKVFGADPTEYRRHHGIEEGEKLSCADSEPEGPRT